MANQFFVISVVFLLSSLCLINSQPFDCGLGDINVAFVYDCRYSLELQQDFFTQFIEVFAPMTQIVSNNKDSGVNTDVNLILMTYKESELMIIERLTKENFTLDRFNESTLKLNTSSCPQRLPLKTVFNDTREALGGYSVNVRKLAIFVLAENLTDYEDDVTALRGLESVQGLNGDVKRLFILLKNRTLLKERGIYSLYTNTVNNSPELLKKSIGIICNSCHKKFGSYKLGTSCYNVIKVYNEKTTREAEDICDQTWPRSHLVFLNSQSELEYVTSIIENVNFYLNTLNVSRYRLNETTIIGFIGLSVGYRGNSKDYKWNDGTPLVVDPTSWKRESLLLNFGSRLNEFSPPPNFGSELNRFPYIWNPGSNLNGFPSMWNPGSNLKGFPSMWNPGSNLKGFPSMWNPGSNLNGFPSMWNPGSRLNGFPSMFNAGSGLKVSSSMLNAGRKLNVFAPTLGGRSKRNVLPPTWDAGSGLFFPPPLDSRYETEGCVYMSLKYSLNEYEITREKLQWHEWNCYQPKLTDFLVCESDMSDVNKLLLNVKDFSTRKQESHLHLLYTSYSHLLFNHINNEMQNSVTSLMKKKISYSVIEKGSIINCKISEDSRKNDGSTNIKQIDLFIQSIQRKRPTCNIKIIDTNSVLSNDNSYLYGGGGYNEQHSKLLNESYFDVMYLKDPIETVQKCLYEIDSTRRRVWFPNNSHLQDCEHFVCPPGFVKCTISYCIPVYLVDDGVKDCPHGEDEVSVNNEATMCTGKLKFTLRNICLQQGTCNANRQCINRNNDFVCEVPCERGFVCVSNIVRKETDDNNTFYIRFVETTVQIYEDLGLYTFTPQIYSLFTLLKLVEINLSNCRISDLDNVIKSLDSSDVIILDVSHNSISGHNNFSVIQEMKNLQKLNMSFNKHLELDENLILPLNLHVLDMSNTQAGSEVIKYLDNLTQLKILELRNVEPIDLCLTGKVKLEILDVRGTELINIKYGYLNLLSIQSALYTDDFRICCQVIRGPNIQENKCHAPRDAVSTCQDLIGDPQKRVILWVVGILSLFGNMVVVIYRIVWDRAVFNKAYGLLVFCLAVSDFIMGVYLIIIAGADLLYRNIYVLEDTKWRYSDTCKLAGILSTFSSETSTMFICLITLDRYLVIKYPFGQHRFSKLGKITSLCLTLIIGVVVSVIPVLFPDWEIYSSNGMCLALPFRSGRHKGWQYSAALFVGLNFFLFILIAIGQLAIFLSITSYQHDHFLCTMKTLRKAQDRAVAKQLFLVAFSDFCCWFPIGIMGIMSLNGFHFNLDVYAWSAVLVLPVNSAINPLIYTVPVIWRKIKSSYLISKLPLRSLQQPS